MHVLQIIAKPGSKLAMRSKSRRLPQSTLESSNASSTRNYNLVVSRLLAVLIQLRKLRNLEFIPINLALFTTNFEPIPDSGF
ncbi:unnamed protein product [Caenorhabditis angaria]|uniref:Uncharacterized protein n=1 Tax=Caenorhabditis angaria TaxID=860376 RepID=A0A9P1I8L9_9PELO|nr:unnamed protein product [Caenorhabditis angaria]